MSVSFNSNLSRRTTALRRLHIAVLAVALTMAYAAPNAYAQRGGARNQQAFNVLPITITNVAVVDGRLIANGLLGTNPFQAPLTLTPQPGTAQEGTCPVLNLSLAPINLSLLGLNVDTSAICLGITAQQGGGLLGDLLCGVANLLNGGVDLATILGSLPPDQVTTLTNGLTQMLNQVFATLTSSQAVTNASCNVLNLALGPLDLTLLGLRVELNDCAAGPVTVDLTATPGGGLLGDLLCGLGNLLNNNSTGNQNAITSTLLEITRVAGGIIG
jgi:uncharacterized membrane protein YeiH